MYEAEAELKGDLLMRIENLQNQNRQFIKSMDNFHVLEYIQDASVSPMNAVDEYFMSKMNVRRRQVVIDLDRNHSAMIQAGAMQWMGGQVEVTSGVRGIGDFFGKAIKGAVTKETAAKAGVCWSGMSGIGTNIQVYYLDGYVRMGSSRHDHRGWYVSCM